ncbi:peptidoglycan D,D-transpeptidase FtsI family protein [Phycisphaerales bacterium AB-hyl4]|uniref:Peptidoglycan D,D-transpeptidase FtsI family protein n=1 Tax=Natronomicrosphaera hydrolytica TaxID=3242702 RepID=A0ABV4U442_9BACT
MSHDPTSDDASANDGLRVQRDARPMARSPLMSGAGADDGSRGAARALWVGRVMMVLLTLVFLLLLVRVGQLQTSPAEPVAKRLDTQTSRHTLHGRRGAILDRRGRVIASSRVAYRLFVDPQLIVDRNTFSEYVGYTLDYDPAWVEMTLHQRHGSRYIVLDERLSDERLAALADFKLPGLAVEPVLVRDYPKQMRAGHLVGFVGVDGHGLEGIERQFDERLRPRPGRMQYLRDARRQPLWVTADAYQPHEDGQPVRLSIDITIQEIAEKQLAETIEKYQAEAGQIVVMHPRTGEILALAHAPSFSPARFRDSSGDDRRNRAVTDVFEPGSIFKPMIWAAMTQMGAASIDEKIDCTTSGVYRSPRGRRLRDSRPLGELTWEEVLMNSSNIGMAIVAQRIGNEKLHDIVRAFGFGATTDSGLSGEVVGLVNPLRQWNHYSETSIPMGQEIGVTALQIVRAFAVFGNDGLLVRPTVEAVDPDDAAFNPIQQRVLLPSVARHTRHVLRRAVEEGTGRHAKSDLYAIWGKTGTAQLPDLVHGGYQQGQYVASFMAGAPLDEPELIVGCFIQKPDRSIGYYGGLVAGPPVKRVIEESLLYLNVSPDAEAHRRQAAYDAEARP